MTTLLAAGSGGAVAPVTADFSDDVFWIWLLKAAAILVFLLVSVLIAICFSRSGYCAG